jgi:hypothetical protein
MMPQSLSAALISKLIGTDMCFELQALTDRVWICIIMQKLKRRYQNEKSNYHISNRTSSGNF